MEFMSLVEVQLVDRMFESNWWTFHGKICNEKFNVCNETICTTNGTYYVKIDPIQQGNRNKTVQPKLSNIMIYK